MSTRPTSYSSGATRYRVNVGFQQYMISIYRFMTFGLGLTALVAFVLASLPKSMMPAVQMLSMISIFGTLGVSLYMSFKAQQLSVQTTNVLFWVYSVFMGAGLQGLFARYTSGSLASVFLITSLTFGLTTTYAHVTKRDLSSMGSLLFMGLIGIFVAGLVNIFLKSSAMGFAISAIGCLVFTGLIAYDTQRLRDLYYQVSNEEDRQKMAIFGALNLYMSVVNLFLSLLNLMGEKKK